MKKARETKTTYVTRSEQAISIPDSLMSELQEMMKWEGVPVEQVLDRALRQYRYELSRRKIDAEAVAYRRRYPRLRAKYLGKHIAMHNGRVVDHDRDPSALYLRVRARFGRIPVLIRLVEEEPERELVFRSPRLEPIK